MRALVGLGMAMALLASQAVAQPAWAQAQSPALTGKVLSDPEGRWKAFWSAPGKGCDHHRDRGERCQG
jgi:hypothetical protein